jgi:hypothetical protein
MKAGVSAGDVPPSEATGAVPEPADQIKRRAGFGRGG